MKRKGLSIVIKAVFFLGVIGAVIGVGYVFVLFMLDNSIKSSEDIEKAMDIPVLANIPVYEADTKIGTRSSKNSKGGKRRWEMN